MSVGTKVMVSTPPEWEGPAAGAMRSSGIVQPPLLLDEYDNLMHEPVIRHSGS